MLVPASSIYGLVLFVAIHGLIVDALAIRRRDGIQRIAEAASVSSTIYSCPTGQHLCPSSVGYGCCPDGMACGVSRCYSSQPVTETIVTAVTTTASGTITTITATSLTVRSASIPTGSALDGRNDDNDSRAADPASTSVPKYVPSSAETDGDDGEDESLSTTQLGGIIGGAIALLALVIAAACVMIRHIDKLAAQISRKSNSSRSRTATKQTSLSSLSSLGSRSSRTDATNASTRRSQTRRKPKSTARRHRQRRNGFIAARPDDLLIQGARGMQESPRDIPLQVLTRNAHGGSAVVPVSRQRDVVSPTAIHDVSPRQLSSPSPLSVTSTELEASSLAQELAGTSNAATLAADSLIHDAQDIPPTDLPRMATRPPLAYQWMRSIGLLRESEVTSPDDYRIEEESHGFYGSTDHVAGRTGLGIDFTEMRGGRPGRYFCPMTKRTHGSV